MRLNNVVRFTSANMGRNISFARAPKKGNEEKEYTKTIQDALDYLEIQNRALIIHGTSFPAIQGEFDTKGGTPIGADKMIEFAKLHGFNSIQLGPNGKLNRGDDYSPYTSSVFEKNPLFINFEQLTKPEFGSILSEEDIAKHAKKTKANGKNYAVTDFKDLKKNTEELIDIAWNNYKAKVNAQDEDALSLNAEHTDFNTYNYYWLEPYAVANILAKKHGTDFYPNWPQDDRELIPRVFNGNTEAYMRYNKISSENNNEMLKYIFTQFILEKQTKLDAQNRGDFGYISDLEVGVSSLDELIWGDAFLKDYKMGCPDGGPMNSPQLWGFGVLDPDKLFNQDGSLGPAGKFIQAKLQNSLSGSKNIRVDHVFGLINPWIYQPNKVQYKTGFSNGQMMKYPDPDKKDQYGARMCNSGIDPKGNFKRIIPEIFIPTMKEMGIDPKKAVWEDLGWDESGVSQQIIKQNDIPGIKCLQWTESQEARRYPNATAYIGCHDNPPAQMMIKRGINNDHKHFWSSGYLSNSLIKPNYKAREREELRQKIERNPKELMKAKFADLFRSTKNIQISFMDFFGINQTYNTPGTSGGENWSLRLNPDYQDTYYKSLENDDWALNMPEILATAVQSKLDEDTMNRNISSEKSHQVHSMLHSLNHWSSVLKEK